MGAEATLLGSFSEVGAGAAGDVAAACAGRGSGSTLECALSHVLRREGSSEMVSGVLSCPANHCSEDCSVSARQRHRKNLTPGSTPTKAADLWIQVIVKINKLSPRHLDYQRQQRLSVFVHHR